MIIRSFSITPAQAGAAAAAIYTVPAGFIGTLKQLVATNTTGTARTITVYLVPSGGSPSATNTVISAMTIPPSGIGQISLAHLISNQVMAAGGTLQVLASAATAISFTGGGIEEVA